MRGCKDTVTAASSRTAATSRTAASSRRMSGTHDTGWLNLTTFTSVLVEAGDIAWSAPSQATLFDNLQALCPTGFSPPVKSEYLKGVNVGSVIPLGATVLGVEVRIARNVNLGTNNSDHTVSLVADDTVQGDNKASATTYTTTMEWVEYGGVDDLWGLTLTPAQINAADFGVVFRTNGVDAFSQLQVEQIQMRVIYTVVDALLEINATNFPSLNVALTSDSVTDVDELTDVINGRVFTAISTGAVTDNGDGTFGYTSDAYDGDTVIPPLPDGYSALMIGVMDWSHSGDLFTFGTDGSNGQFRIQIDGGFLSVHTPITHYLATGAGSVSHAGDLDHGLTNAVLVTMTRRINRDGHQFIIDDNFGYEDGPLYETGNISTPWPAISGRIILGTDVEPGTAKGMFLFYFKHQFSKCTIEIATKWMYANQGYIWPGFYKII